MEIKQVTDLVRALQRANGDSTYPCGKAVFLVGAGCSKSAGIPLSSEIANQCAGELTRRYSNGEIDGANSANAIAWLKANSHILQHIRPEELYGYLFEHHYQDPREQQRIILDAIRNCDGKINWAHLCLGELVNQRYIHTVLTTNFDQLVLEGIIRTGIIPVVADGVESLTRVTSKPHVPQVVHLHGSMHTYRPLNSISAVTDTQHDLPFQSALYTLLHDSSLLVVIGYAGGEEGVMSLLVESARRLPDKVIYWVQYSSNPEELSNRARELLNCGKNKFLVAGWDADAVFVGLMKGLNLGAPTWMKQPIKSLIEHAERIVLADNHDVSGVVVAYRKRLLGYQDAESAHEKALREIKEFRLEGYHEKALQRAQEHCDEITAPDVWVMCGDSAYQLGRWELSIGSYQTALRFIEKEADAKFWAETQDNLGNALRKLGESKRDGGTLNEAVEAYREALKVYNRKNTPLDWARVQDNLGVALTFLSDELRADKIKLLETALRAHRNALEIYTSVDTPLEWAKVKNNLGQVLRKLGKHKKDVALLIQAVEIHKEALDVCNRDYTPLIWAMTQDNLGMALHRLGCFEKNYVQLKQAVNAYKKALRVYERERLQMTFDCAQAQGGLGNVLRELGDLTRDATWFYQAGEAFKKALEVYEDQYEPTRYRVTKECLTRVEDSLRRLASGGSLRNKGRTTSF